jgi:hypothetical protein
MQAHRGEEMGPRFSRVGAISAAVCLVVGAEIGTLRNAEASGFVTGGFNGYDICTDPPIGAMSDWWTYPPAYNWYIYLGGTQACDPVQSNLSTSWINQATGNISNPTMHWNLMPIWVGLQAPCNTVGATAFSLNPTTAYNQGVNEAAAAATKWHDTYGQSWSTPIAYDLEPFDATLSGPCQGSLAAAQSFINGYVHQLHIAPAQKAGVYGSGCQSHLQRLVTIANVPDFIWSSDWNTAPSPATIGCVAASYWTNHQRHKQYRGPHDETHGSWKLHVDSDCSNGWMYGLWNNGWAACQDVP